MAPRGTLEPLGEVKPTNQQLPRYETPPGDLKNKIVLEKIQKDEANKQNTSKDIQAPSEKYFTVPNDADNSNIPNKNDANIVYQPQGKANGQPYGKPGISNFTNQELNRAPSFGKLIPQKVS